MKLWIVSDLHVETRRDFRIRERPEFDVLVMAGDLVEGDIARGIAITAEMAQGRPAIFVAGNHEFYGFSIAATHRAAEMAAGERGVHFLKNNSAVVDGVRFFGGTLWELPRPPQQRPNLSNILSGLEQDPPPHSALPVNEPIFIQGPGVMDRRAKNRDIRHQYEMTVAAAKQADADVVVTHYPPPDSLVAAVAPKLWIHGHEHRFMDKTVGGTRILNNAMGMMSENRNLKGFADVVVDFPAPAATPQP